MGVGKVDLAMFEDETPIAWRSMPQRASVVGRDGTEFAVAEKLLGDEDADIFHGVVAKRSDGALVEVSADRIKRMTEHHVITDLDPEEVAALPRYRTP